MTPMAISWIAFLSVSGGALLGILLRGRLSEHHLSEESKDVVKLGNEFDRDYGGPCSRPSDCFGEEFS